MKSKLYTIISRECLLHSLVLSGFLIALFVNTPMAKAKIYQWKGAGGIIHYSQFPPSPSIQAKPVEIQPIPTYQNAIKKSPSTPSKSQKTTHKKTKHSLTPIQCRKIQENLKILQSGRRVRLKEPNGKIKWITPSERKNDIKMLKKNIQRGCVNTA